VSDRRVRHVSTRRVVHENRQATEMRDGVADQTLARVLVAEVGGDEPCRSVRRLDLVDDLLAAFGVASGHDHTSTFAAERDGDCTSYA
jgi:hypothetical protein